MVRKHNVYQGIGVVWTVLSFGAAIVTYTGNAEPYVSASQLPAAGTPLGLFGSGLALMTVGWLVLAQFEKRSWRAMARRVGLASEGRLLPYGVPDLTGSVHGRSVLVHTHKRKTGGGAEGSNTTTYTRIEAELSGPADEGLLVARSDGDGPAGLDALPAGTTTIDGFAVIGPEELARAVLTSRVRNAVESMVGADSVTVGDASGAMVDALPDTSNTLVGALYDGVADSSAFGDDATATVETKGLLLEPDRLETQVEAAVAVADAFEEATADRRPETAAARSDGGPA